MRRKYTSKLSDAWRLQRRDAELAKQKFAALTRNCSVCNMPSTSGSLVNGRCHACSEKRATEMERRVRLARKALSGGHTGNAPDHGVDAPCDECDAVAALDLRKPLHKK